ncbi:hypothetical protein AAIH32_08830 [Pseudarthrobacter oxydans]|uniref:hypothetical protein n=1 Tax=Pseudarthrobacter oxydans TaxID=1671 RepID=UPI003D289EAC
MKTRNAVATCAVAAASSIGLAAPASAAPSGTGCPQGFDTLSVKEIIRVYATRGFESAIKGEDRNKDGLLCFKLLPPAVDFFDPTFFYQDNEFPVTA